MVGLVYVLTAGIVKMLGTKWIDKLIPLPIVIGPMIMVIGLGLASSAAVTTTAGFVADGDIRHIIVAIATFLITSFINTKGKGFSNHTFPDRNHRRIRHRTFHGSGRFPTCIG